MKKVIPTILITLIASLSSVHSLWGGTFDQSSDVTPILALNHYQNQDVPGATPSGPEPATAPVADPKPDLEDSDGDGILNQEECGPNGDDTNYDGNGDGSADCTQANVVSGYNHSGSHYLTLSVPAPAQLEEFQFVETPSSAEAPLGVNFLLDCFTFKVTNAGSGGAVSVTVHHPENIKPVSYHNYGATPEDEEAKWYPFESDGTTGARLNESPLQLLFVDGQRGDNDLDATNGEITSTGGPAVILGPPADPVTPDDTTPDDTTPDDTTPDGATPDGSVQPPDGGGGSCFLDTLFSGF